MPASWFGRDRSCWSDGHTLCVKKNGKSFKGRKCCLKPGVDPSFVDAHNDPHNLFPAGRRGKWRPIGLSLWDD